MNFNQQVARRRFTKVTNYLTALTQELVLILQDSGVSGEHIYEHVLGEHDTLWQVPPIETVFVDRKFLANFLKDTKGILRGTLGELSYVYPKWAPIAAKVAAKEPSAYLSHVGYVDIYRVTGLSATDTKLIFTPPSEASVGSLAAQCLFAVESAAFFAYVCGLSLEQDASSYHVHTPSGPTGVVNGKIFLDGRLIDGKVSKELLNISLRLPRGEGFDIPTKDTIDAIRTWAVMESPAEIEYILDILSILRLAKPGEHLVALNTSLLQMRPRKKPRKYVSYHKKQQVSAARKVLSMEQRELDYIKVQDILGDSSRVDKVKLLDISEILIPMYMSYSTFVNKIGYPAGKNTSAAMFTKQRYDKMLSGWSKFRDESLDRARSKLQIKFEDR